MIKSVPAEMDTTFYGNEPVVQTRFEQITLGFDVDSEQYYLVGVPISTGSHFKCYLMINILDGRDLLQPLNHLNVEIVMLE